MLSSVAEKCRNGGSWKRQGPVRCRRGLGVTRRARSDQRTTTPGGPPMRVAVVVVTRIAKLHMSQVPTRNRRGCQKPAHARVVARAEAFTAAMRMLARQWATLIEAKCQPRLFQLR